MVASRSAKGEVCLGSDSFQADETDLGTRQFSQLDADVFAEVRLRLFADSPKPSSLGGDSMSKFDSHSARATTVGASAQELLIEARLTLRTAVAEGTVKAAVDQAYDEANKDYVLSKTR